MIHKNYMEIASRMSLRAKGTTSPNPPVGAIIVKDDKIISRGWTGCGGTPHAEIVAINKVRNKSVLKDSSLYCTLEPCSHKGKTKPCVDQIIKSKIKNIYISQIDKNKIINGKGIKKLKSNNINVKIISNKNINFENKIFFNSKNKNKPYITLKIASTADGKIATSNYKSKWITSKQSRLVGHTLRLKNDCILIASNTVIKDNPFLDCRLDGLEKYSPDIFILDRELKIDLSSNIFKNSKRKIHIFYSLRNIENKIKKKYGLKNVKLIYIKNVDGLINIKKILSEIGKYGYQRVLVEGGSKLSGSLLKNNLVNKIAWFRASKLIGDEGLTAVSKLGITDMKYIKKFKLSHNKRIGNDTLNIYLKD